MNWKKIRMTAYIAVFFAAGFSWRAGILNSIDASALSCLALFLSGWAPIAEKRRPSLRVIYGLLLAGCVGIYIAARQGAVGSSDAIFGMGMLSCTILLIGSAKKL